MRLSHWVLFSAFCSVLAVDARAEVQPLPDCKSALPPRGDFKVFLDACRSQATARRAAAPTRSRQSTRAAVGETTVYDSRTTVAGLDFTNVPTWSDADILSQFAATRDSRYMTMTFPPDPEFARRISWMYPDDGCYARAEQVNVRVAQAGKTRPYKLFAFGKTPELRVYTDNTVSGVMNWWYHVVPVVKNSAGEPIVLDAALSPCKPLHYKKWLELMVDDMALYDNLADGHGVALGDSWSYMPFDLPSGEPSHSEESLNAETGLFLYSEWSRQIQLGRDPNVVLGAAPPWSGSACLKTEVETQTASLAPGASATVSATCPFATLAVGGGLGLSTPSLAVSKNARSGNAWQVSARNNGSAAAQLSASAVCLSGVPSTGSVSTSTGNTVSVSPNSFNTSTASCTTGTLVGGGYTTTLGSGTVPVMRVYNNSRTSSTSASWQASGYNASTTAKSITAHAYCLTNTNYAVNQSSTSLPGSSIALASCGEGSRALGGGFQFPRQSAYNVTSMQNWGSAYMVNMLPTPPDGDPNAKAHAQCLLNPE